MEKVAYGTVLLVALALVPPGAGCGAEDPDGAAHALDADYRARDEADFAFQDGVVAVLAYDDACPWEEGDWHYCRDCGPCSAGVGDCDVDAECEPGLLCAQRAGEVDVCEVACPWEEGAWHYCRDCGPCSAGVGDCDTDAECDAGLVCVQRAGEVDVCEVACPWEEGDWHYCRDCGPCSAGVGDCDTDAECEAGLVCVQRAGEVDVCEVACPWEEGDWDYCRDCGPCPEGAGDCDSDAECEEGLVCNYVTGKDSCGQPPTSEAETRTITMIFGVYSGHSCSTSDATAWRDIIDDFYNTVSGGRVTFELADYNVQAFPLGTYEPRIWKKTELYQAAVNAGLNLSTDHLMWFFSDSDAKAHAVGNNSYFGHCGLETPDRPKYGLRHELGHNLRLADNGMILPPDSFGQQIDIYFPDYCRGMTYEICLGRDPLSIMGNFPLNNMLGLSAPNLIKVGWVSTTNVVNAQNGVTYEIDDYESRDNSRQIFLTLQSTVHPQYELVVAYLFEHVIVYKTDLDGYSPHDPYAWLLPGQSFEGVEFVSRVTQPRGRARVRINR